MGGASACNLVYEPVWRILADGRRTGLESPFKEADVAFTAGSDTEQTYEPTTIRRAPPDTRTLAPRSSVNSTSRRDGMPMSSPWMISIAPP